MTEIIRIPFHGDDILTIDVDGKPHIVFRPAIEALDLDYPTQYTKLRERSWATIGQSPVVASDGKVRDMITVDVRTFLMLLATINENKVPADIRPKLIMYQAEVADVIEAYWTRGGAINPRATDEQLAAIINRAKQQMEVLHLAAGIVDPTWLESKARHVTARALGEEPEDDPARRLLTVGEYLDERGVTPAAARRLGSRFGKLLKARYVQRHGQPPGVSRRFVDGAQREVAVYTEADRDLFDAVWQHLAHGGDAR